MSLKRWQKIFVAAAAVVLPILSCSQRSLVIVTVMTPNGVTAFQGSVDLVIHAGNEEQARFDAIMFEGGQYKAGVYLPSDMSGDVSLKADVEQSNCIIATGNGTATGVQPGQSVPATVQLDSVPCQPVDGGAGGTTGQGRSAGALGSGGMMGTGGTNGLGGATGQGGSTGAGGAIGSGGKGGSGTGGSTTGSGGVNGTGGATGNGGATGKGGVTGTGGIPTTGSGGTTGAGGATGTGGLKGSGGTVGSGGSGSGGSGSGGSGGSGSGGSGSGGLGSGGSSGCTCPDPNELCSPASGVCVCSQTDSEACMNLACGSTTNICNQMVTCPNNCPSGSSCIGNLCRPIVTTGCGGSIATGGGLVAGTDQGTACPAQ